MIRAFAPKKMFHPAIGQLHGFLVRAKLNAVVRRVQTPQRRGLILLSVLLGCVWLGQAVAGILFRAPADPVQIRFWIPAAMVVYCLYHLVKILTRSPETPFEWTTAEQELLQGAPLSRLQLINWRLRSIFTAAIAKAICFAIVMSPDVPSVLFASVGMLGALLMIDLFRLSVGMAVNAMTNRERWLCRIGLVTPLVGIIAWTIYCCLTCMNASNSPAHFSITLMLRSAKILLGLLAIEPFSWMVEPFGLFSSVIFANAAPLQVLGSVTSAAALLMLTLFAMLGFDHLCQKRIQSLESESWDQVKNQTNQKATTRPKLKQSNRCVAVPWNLGGVGPIAYRQLLGAWHFRNAIRFALLIPTLLCCLPMFADATQATMMMNVGGSLVFYTFLLLPSGLILDYRRDIDRMTVLKSLPISPWALTWGQLTTPVLLASMFQIVVLTIGTLTSSISLVQALIAFVVLIPFNILNFALENYLFMLSPYRRNDEGVMVFVRTILTFTAKGIMFAIAFAITLTWVILSVRWGNTLRLGPWAGPAFFVLGMWLLVGIAAALFATLLTRKIESFDVSIDSPAG